MGYKIEEIEGIGPAYKTKLSAAGIDTTEDFLERCGSSKGRQAVATQTGVSEKRLLEWANLADLMRVSGIGPQFSELLEASGVDTVKELRHRNAANLAAKLAEVNGVKKLARTSPAESVVEGWIAAAKDLQPLITH